MYLVWLRVAAILYAVASLTALPAVLYAFPRWRKICLPAASLAFLFHLVSATEMLGLAHRWVPVGYGEVESLLALLIAALFLAISRIYGTVSFGVFALPASFLLVFVPSLGTNRYAFPSAGVRIGWLVVHIAFLLAAYASLAFSMVASFLYLAQERRLKSRYVLAASGAQNSWFDRLPPLDTLERIAHSTLLFGFPCMTLGLLVGSLLAQESVGAAYFFDPKVLLSFAMWILYIVLLHIRRSAGLRGRRAAYLSSGVFVVMLVVWAANQFSQVHRFPAP
ncbi:cytochrome C assembly family protein [Acidicapsa ligni]|uniref:cytochrome C assembly family protein n=1 Tax=Acidicapsa ligni TaxID=542300 RepID=UPI0021E0E479|nr:cytochrome c biogenesis protein [Acidicapsa ligni]